MNNELGLILITNEVIVAKMAECYGVEYIMVDLEKNGKVERQGHLDTYISDHTADDVKKIKKVLNVSKLLVRVNPIYEGTKEEIEMVIESGADAIMLPMFTSVEEVKKFIDIVNGRVTTVLLFETSQSLVRMDSILDVGGIDIAYIGLNDLHLSLNLKFMFELLSSGLLEYMANKITKRNIRFGFGGVARVGEGILPAEHIIREHGRLGSNLVILSRTFKKMINSEDGYSSDMFANEISKIKKEFTQTFFLTKNERNDNIKQIKILVDEIVK